ncbi:zinc ribbon domain-containing protein [Methanoculleus sp.]|uniref:zinc ribbon domain-containing protein n=1 Tax=Methanoculleus sp. TaxID=90427 RepID=UPI001BD58FD5|nr:zinc ribbon domain-containing protein [Methanoculleus sp.]
MARRKLRKISGRERRFKTDTNRVISKRIVCAAEGTKRGIALEDLKGILLRSTVKKFQRERRHKWAFHQLRSFVDYKARRVRRSNGTEQEHRRCESGVAMRVIGRAYTSQQCSVCRLVHPDNRPTQAAFRRLACGHAENADLNAAKNIAAGAPVNEPIAVRSPGDGGEMKSQACKEHGATYGIMPPTSVGGS